MSQKLYRSKKDRLLSGVVGGFAEYFKIDATLLRIGTVILGFVAGFQLIIAYIICLILIPEKPDDLEDDVDVFDENGNKMNNVLKSGNGRMFLGIAIVAFGCIQLFDHFFWWVDHDIYLGVGIIAIGAIVLVTSIKKKNEEEN